MVKQLKNRFQDTFRGAKNLPKKIAAGMITGPQPDVRQILKTLSDELEQHRTTYTKNIDILREKYNQDVETIKIGLTQLAKKSARDLGIPEKKILILKKLAEDYPVQEKPNLADRKKLEYYEDFLATLEKEIMEILSGHFGK